MRQVKNRALLHFVWATYDRMPWMIPEIASPVYRYIETVARNDGCDVLAVGGMSDHVHLFVCMSATVSIAQLMQHVKGGSSYLIQHELAPGAFFKWQGSYGVFSVRPSDKERVVAYIGNQEQRHRDGSLWAGGEPDMENPPDSQ